MNNTENPYKNLDKDKLDKVLKDVTKDRLGSIDEQYQYWLIEDYSFKSKTEKDD